MIDPGLLKVAIEVVAGFLRRRVKEGSSAVSPKVERHLREALRWSQRIQFYGMSKAEETDAATIPLRMNVEPRRFRSPSAGEHRSEVDLLGDDDNYFLLGDPGAGKTTTLKRLVQRLLLERPSMPGDVYQFPIVLRLRELRLQQTLYEAIAQAVGIPVERRHEQDDPDAPVEMYVGTQLLRDAIVEFLNESHIALLLDGLDEVSPGEQFRLRRELSWLALNAEGSKILVSCRSGDYTTHVEGFDLLEICPLDAGETSAIARAWLSDPASFLEALSNVPYRDLTDRPLLLTQLLYVYKRYGYLPEQPSQVYRKVISLLLQEWDAERDIARQSKYAQFAPERKMAFLSAVAYYLTYRVKKKIFKSNDLEAVYLKIHDRFRLPRDEARQVIGEIETHTGLVVAAGRDTYEFTHLSLQEFLCADYLIREPHSEHLADYLIAYPAPVAITIALSSNPSTSFAALFLRTKTPPVADVHSLIARVILEQPFFDVSPALGTAVLKLYRDFQQVPELQDLLFRFLDVPNTKESIAAALPYYESYPEREALQRGHLRLKRRKPLDGVLGFKTPDLVCLPMALRDTLVAQGFTQAQAFSASKGDA
jgi:predicted NACHT family NTPase